MNDETLERYARHLALPAIGVPGQETLLASAFSVDPRFSDVIAALVHMGIRVDPTAPRRIFADETLREGEVLFEHGNVAIGPQAFSGAKHRDASAPLHMKQRFFGALVASEITLWLLGVRPAVFSLEIDYPHYAFQP